MQMWASGGRQFQTEKTECKACVPAVYGNWQGIPVAGAKEGRGLRRQRKGAVGRDLEETVPL